MTFTRLSKYLHNLTLNKESDSSVLLVAATLFFLVIAHYYQSTGAGGHGLMLPFNVATWIAVSLWISGVALLVAGRKILFVTQTSQLLAVCCLLMSLPLLYPEAEIEQAMLRMAGLWLGLLLLVSAQQFKVPTDHLSLLLLIILGGVWIEGLRYWQAMLNTYFAIGVFPSAEAYPLLGVFQQRNVMATFIATGIVLSAYLLSAYKNWRYGRFCLPLLLLTPVFFIQVLYAMASRAGWYGALFGLLLLIPFALKNIDRKLILAWVLMFGIGFLVPELLKFSGGWLVPEKDILSLAGARTILFPQAIGMFLSQPWFGFGYGTFEPSYMAFMAEQYALGSSGSIAIPNTSHPHNEILFWAVEGGIVPLLALCLAAGSVWIQVRKFAISQRLALVALFLPLALHSQVEFPFYASAVHWVIFIILIYYVDALAEAPRVTVPCPTLPAIIFSGLVSLVSVIFLSVTLSSGILLTRFNASQSRMDSIFSVSDSLVWGDRANYAIYSTLLNNGIAASNPAYIQEYIDWVPELLTKQPRAIFYENLILAHQALNQSSEAERVIQEFHYLFPETEFTIVQVD